MTLFRRILLATLFLLGTPSLAPAQPPQVQDSNFGWAGAEVAAQARRESWDAPPELHVVGEARANVANKVIALWHATKRMEVRNQAGEIIKPRGQHLPNIPQQTTDCVSFGWSSGVNYSLATAMSLGQADGRFRTSFQPYIFGISRVKIGGTSGRGGSTGAWAIAGIKKYGVLPSDEEGLPAYSGSLANAWGSRPGPPEKWIEIGKQHCGDGRLITDWDGLCQAMANGWPVSICSGYGFEKIIEANGRIEGVHRGSWSHCMCLIAVDTRSGREAAYCLNSWGPNAHAKASRYAELDGAPPGGFWVLREDVEGILRARDSYAVSFTGFKAKSSTYEKLMQPGNN